MDSCPSYAVCKIRKSCFFWVVWPNNDDWELPIAEGEEESRGDAETAALEFSGPGAVPFKARVARAYLNRSMCVREAKEERARAAKKAAASQEERQKIEEEDLARAIRREAGRLEERTQARAREENDAVKNRPQRTCWACCEVSTLLINSPKEAGHICPLCHEQREADRADGIEISALTKPQGYKPISRVKRPSKKGPDPELEVEPEPLNLWIPEKRRRAI